MALNEQNGTAEEPRSAEGALTKRSGLETIGLVSGVVGGTALVFAITLYVIDPGVIGLAVLNTCFAVVALVFYGMTNRRSLGRAFAGRSTAFVFLEVLIVLGVLGAVIAANYFAAKSTKEWDLTRDALFSLEPQSVKVASGLKAPVKIVAFLKSGDAQRQRLVDLVSLYRQHTPLVELEIINPDSAPPAVLEEYKMTATSPRIVVAGAKGQTTKIRQPTEELLTNALVKVAERPQRKIYFLTGHGEPSIDDDKSETGYAKVANDLRDEGYEVAAISLLDRDVVPVDASAVILAGPRSPLFPNETAALKAWLDRGGRVLALLEPATDPGVSELLAGYGIVVGNDVVVDPSPAGRAFGFGADTTVVQRFEAHPITDPLTSVAALFQGARSVSPKLTQADVKATTLIQTTPESWAETNWQSGKPEKDEADLAGPVPIAVATTMDTFTVQGRVTDQLRLVTFGDGSFATNRFSALSGNDDLFVNAVNWLVGDEAKISMRPKSRGASRLLLTESQQYGVMFFSVNLLPLIIIGFGFSVWAVRRRK
ncbi:GldG family protein [Myxococcota bacterium]|nr:GldG family protein [Myxococcota bacterium]